MDVHEIPGYGRNKELARLFHAWLDCFVLLKLGATEVCALQVLLAMTVANTISSLGQLSALIHLLLSSATQAVILWCWTMMTYVVKWKHFLRYWPFVRGIHWSPVNSPHKGQWRRALMLSLICAWINGWVNNCEAGDLRHHRAHYDVTVMSYRTWRNLVVKHYRNCPESWGPFYWHGLAIIAA